MAEDVKTDAPKTEKTDQKDATAPAPPLSSFAPADSTPNLNAALCAAVASTPWVEYTQPEKNGGINYEYLSEEDIVKALRVVLPKFGLTITPRTMEILHKENYSAASGGRMVNLLIRVGYRLSHVSGEYVEGQAIGEGSDRGDKAANKAMTGAYKYYLRQLFMIAGGLDPDRTHSDQLARAEKTAARPTGPAQNTKTDPKKDAKPQKPMAERLADALAHVAKLNGHDAIKSAAKQAGTVFTGDANKDKLDKVYNACAARATLLYTAEVGKAEDLEAVDAVLKRADADKIGTANMAKLKAAAEKKQAAIAAESGAGSGDGAGDGGEPEPLDF